MMAQRTPEQEILYEKIRHHLSELSASSQFTARLARENK
jgi:hypothetical protein